MNTMNQENSVSVTFSPWHDGNVVFINSGNSVFVYSFPNDVEMAGSRFSDFKGMCVKYRLNIDQSVTYKMTSEEFLVFQDEILENGYNYINKFELEDSFYFDRVNRRTMYIPSMFPRFKAVSFSISDLGKSLAKVEYRFFDKILGIVLGIKFCVKKFYLNFSNPDASNYWILIDEMAPALHVSGIDQFNFLCRYISHDLSTLDNGINNIIQSVAINSIMEERDKYIPISLRD